MTTPAGLVDGLLAGRYRLVSRIAAGGVGEVWRARDLLLDREVAVKTLRAELADDEDVRARFSAEARHTGRLAHPGIAAVYDFGESDGRTWLVLELVEGRSLREVLRSEGRLDAARTLDIVAQTAAALAAAHRAGVIHRDVKPGNLLVRPDGRVKVTDFGIAWAAGAAPLTRTGQVVGTAAYLAPEQADGRGATASSDLYALGVVAYESLSGAVPFAYDTPVAVLLAHLQTPPPPLPDDVPAPVAELVGSLLAKDPDDRPASAQDVVARAAAAQRALSVVPVAAAPTAVLPPAHPTAVLRPPAAVPVSPARPAPHDRVAGLSSRPGQRRAVRATAVLLGLLAVALGLRESLTGSNAPGPGPVRTPVSSPAASGPPTSVPPSTPPAPAPVTPAPPAGDGAPVVVPPQQDQPAPEPEQAGDDDPGQDDAGQQPEDAEDAEAEKEEEGKEQAREREADRGKDGPPGGDKGKSEGKGKDG